MIMKVLLASALLTQTALVLASTEICERTLNPELRTRDARSVCQLLKTILSPASQVFFPGSASYASDIDHYNTASTQNSTCSVEPGNQQDVAKILKLVGSTRTQFAVKGAGHAFNLGFSSTTGVHVALTRFNQIVYDKKSSTVDLGAGLRWEDVYAKLTPLGINVPGGRVSGVGVAGFLLGGGYSWHTNQVGLSIDNVVAFDLVTPKGDFIHVDKTKPDLFFALKGGFNNFGIVTNFKVKAFNQGPVVGGLIAYDESQLHNLGVAISRFAKNAKDKKAEMLALMGYNNGTTFGAAVMYYDGPVVPKGTFDDFLNIPSVENDFKQRTFLDFFTTLVPLGVPKELGVRWVEDTVSLVDYTPSLVDQFINTTKFWAENGKDHEVNQVLFIPEPFMKTIFQNATDSAYPHSSDHFFMPLSISFGSPRGTASEDSFWQKVVKDTTDLVYNQALREGQNIAISKGRQIRYPNYAGPETPLELIWGNNIPRLKQIRKTVDPDKVMDLTGGFRV